MSGLLVIARDDRLDDALARGALEQGYQVLRLDLIATQPGGDADRLLAWLPRTPDGAAIAWTSRRAGEALAATALPGRRDALARVPRFAVGEESAAPIRRAGLAVTTPAEGSSDAKQLAALIAAASRISRVAFLHGDRSLPDLPEALRGAGIEVEAFELYRTRFLSPDVAEVERAASAGRLAAVAFFSPSGIEALERLLHPETAALLRRNTVALARGATTHAALLARGYRKALRPDAGEAVDSFALEALQFSSRTTR